MTILGIAEFIVIGLLVLCALVFLAGFLSVVFEELRIYRQERRRKK